MIFSMGNDTIRVTACVKDAARGEGVNPTIPWPSLPAVDLFRREDDNIRRSELDGSHASRGRNDASVQKDESFAIIPGSKYSLIRYEASRQSARHKHIQKLPTVLTVRGSHGSDPVMLVARVVSGRAAYPVSPLTRNPKSFGVLAEPIEPLGNPLDGGEIFQGRAPVITGSGGTRPRYTNVATRRHCPHAGTHVVSRYRTVSRILSREVVTTA